MKKQNYISSELTHFVGRSLEDDEARYSLLIDILKNGILRGKVDNGHGSTMVQVDPKILFSSNDSFNANIVCFCDIPVSDFEIHMNKYSRFGLAFSKCFLEKFGARPVFYIPKDACYVTSPLIDIFDKNIRLFCDKNEISIMEHLRQITEENKFNSEETEVLDLFNFFTMQLLSFIKFFNTNKQDDDPDNFYMEREWRSLERIEFKIDDIARIILPSSYIKRFFQDVPEYNGHITTV